MLRPRVQAIPAARRGIDQLFEEGWSYYATEELEARILQDAFYLVSLVALNFNAAGFNPAANPARFLDLLRQVLFLRQTNPREILHHSHRLATPMCRLTDNVYPPAFGVLLSAPRCLVGRA